MSTSSTLATELRALFPNQELTKHSGRPTFSAVREIEKQIEENAGSVVSSVPGTEDYNHIFLVKTNIEWTTLTGRVPVALPINPPRVPIPNNATAARIAQINREYDIAKQLFNKTNTMKELLINQIVSCFDARFIKPLRHHATKQLSHHSIPTILRALYNYQTVKSSLVNDKESELLSTPVNLEDPLMLLFDDIEDLQSLSQAARVPKTTAQIMDLTLNILKNCGSCFTLTIMSWNDRPAIEKTWTNLKQHFEQAQQKLQNASDLPIGQTQLQQANLLAQQVAQNINQDLQHQLNILQQTVEEALHQRPTINNMSSTNNDSSYSDSSDIDDHPEPEDTPTTALKHFFEDKINSMQAEHRKQLDDLKNEIKRRSNPNNDRNSSRRGSNRNNNGRGRQRRNNDRDRSDSTNNNNGTVYREGDYERADVTKYCWTHGACGHTGDQCTRRRSGHQVKATFKDKKGGSTRFCKYVKNKE